jgi:hypothetical protein
MALTTYAEVRPWARAIREAVVTRKMPPWFADARYGAWEHDRRLGDAAIATLAAWAEAGAPEGPAAGVPKVWRDAWNLPRVDAVLTMPEAFRVPATEPVDYQYIVIAGGSTEDRWVRGVEVRPTDRRVVHHAVVYVRKAGDTWTRGPTTADILTVYAPGSPPEVLPEDMAKLIPAGADLVLEVHYTPAGEETLDRIAVGLLLTERPAKRVLTLQMATTDILIPPGAREHRIAVWGTLPNDAELIGFFPHMHLLGRSFEFTIVREGGDVETLLRVAPYDFHWQLAYRLQQPRLLKKGTRLNWIATYDNSAGAAAVRYGLQSWDEMMVGFFDVAVDAAVDKEAYFVR